MVDGLLQVEGGRPLTGEITVRGAKNLVPKAMVGALLGSTPSVLRNVPLIRDVDVVSGLLSLHGVSIDYDQREGILQLDPSKVESAHMADIDAHAGSSREHAVWALKDYGFKVVLAPRFADIFRGNAGKQGLVAGVVSQEDCEQLWKILETEPGTEVTVDLENRTVEAGSFRCAFSIDDYVRWILMEGLDDISLTLTQEDAIRAYEEARPAFKPRTLPAKHLPAQEVVSARAADMPRP